MSTNTVNFPPLAGSTPITEDGKKIDPDAHIHLLALYRGHPLQTVDTSGGSANFPVPLAKGNQNVEITFLKTSADANTPTLTRSGNDKINGANSANMGTAQFSKMKLKSDGVSNWYITG